MIKFILFFSICFANNPLYKWIDQNSEIINQDIKSISFQLNIDSQNYDTSNDSIISGKIIFGKKKQFRFEMGYRTVVSNGNVWKSYDERTNQIIIQEPDEQLERSIFSWMDVKKIRALPIKLESDGGYRFNLLGRGNDVRAYFNSSSNELKSIIIIQNNIISKFSNITLSMEDALNLEIGLDSSTSFDLR